MGTLIFWLVFDCLKIIYNFFLYRIMNHMSNVRGVKFIHMNTRSLFRRIDEIRLLYTDFDLICCSETWLDDRHSDILFHIDHKKLFRLDRLSGRVGRYRYNCGGGVCIYARDKWVSYCTVYSDGSKTCSDFEILTSKIDKPNFKTFFFSSVYKPPRGDSKELMGFISSFVNINSTHEFWILGDFNTDFLKRNVPATRDTISLIRNLGFSQLINSVTRPSLGKGTCIDWILTNSEFVAMSFVSNNLISDHYPVICVHKKAREIKSKVPRMIRLYNRLDLKVLGDLVKNLDWNIFASDPDPNTKWLFIKDNVSKIIEVMCPLKRIFVRKSQPPWFNNTISKLIRDRVRLARLFRNTGDSDVLRNLKIVRNNVTQAVREARSKYMNILLSRNKNNPRKFWRIINSFYANTESAGYDGQFIDPLSGVHVPIDICTVSE